MKTGTILLRMVTFSMEDNGCGAMKRLGVVLSFILFVGLPSGVLLSAEEPAPADATLSLKGGKLKLDFEGIIQNMVYFKNDSDFDRSQPFYNTEGQTVGFAGTIFTPKFLLQGGNYLWIYYEAELGINVWSRNNPDEQSPLADDIFLLKHRQIWSKFYLVKEVVGIKAGYQRFIDPTGLFINHWIGVGSIFIKGRSISLEFSAGQIPDSTYEGIHFNANNFKHDTFLTAVEFDGGYHGWLRVKGGVFSLVDSSVVKKPLLIVMPVVSVSAELGNFNVIFDSALQTGKHWNHSVEGRDEILLGWAIQGCLKWARGSFMTMLNFLLLSPDDDGQHNGFNTAFYYSGKNRSSTILMTEDEFRDKYDNYDELLGSRRGGFFLIRGGMALVDVSADFGLWEFVYPGVTSGVMLMLNPDNVAGYTFGGVEVMGRLRVKFRKNIVLNLAGGGIIPGGAMSVKVNKIDPEAREPLFMVETILDVKI